MNHSFVSALITTFIKQAKIELLIVLTVQGDARENDNADLWVNKNQQLMTDFMVFLDCNCSNSDSDIIINLPIWLMVLS